MHKFKGMKEKILSKEVVFDDFFKIERWEYQYEKENGELTEPVDRLCFNRVDSAVAAVYNTDTQKVILIKQFRHCTYEKGPGWMIEAMAGKLDEGETPEEALVREGVEEIGYHIRKMEKIMHVYASPGCMSECMHLYYAEVINADKVSDGGGLAEEGEYIETVEFTLQELKDALANNELPDSKTVISCTYLLNKHGY